MRWHPINSSCCLVQASDLRGGDAPEVIRHHQQVLRQTLRWAHDYLCRSHPELGRKGPICPFVETSLQQDLFFLTVYENDDGRAITIDEVYQVVIKYRDWFQELEPREGTEAHYKTILVVFPGSDTEYISRIIDVTQERLKPEFVERGLMIGEFHPGPPKKPGLWNPDFRPLFSPVPLLAIRHMVPTDFPFLKHHASFVESYLRTFSHAIPGYLRDEVREVATRFGLTA